MKKNKKEKEVFTPNSSVDIEGTKVDTYKTTVESINYLGLEVGTTGHMGGDSGHGGRTFFKLSNEGCTDLRYVMIDGDCYDAREVSIVFGGDCELDTLCEALRIGYEVLSEHATPIEEYVPSPLEQRQERFALYVNELCELYRLTGSLKGMSDIRNKHHITGLTQQQFFEANLNNANGYVTRGFCDDLYNYLLDTTNNKAIPEYK